MLIKFRNLFVGIVKTKKSSPTKGKSESSPSSPTKGKGSDGIPSSPTKGKGQSPESPAKGKGKGKGKGYVPTAAPITSAASEDSDTK